MMRRASLLVALAALAALAGSPGTASAGTAVATDGAVFPASVSVGDANRPGTISIRSISTGPPDTAPFIVRNIHLLPSCGVHNGFTPERVCPQPQPGVFALSATGTGRAGTACAGATFAIAVIDPATGNASFTPPAPLMLAGTGAICLIDFTFAVLSSPTIDCAPGFQGIQTCFTTYADGDASELFAASANSPGCGITVFPPVVPPCGASPIPPTGPTASAAQAGGTASLGVSPAGCVRKSLVASVTGGEIAKVTFSIDGERRAGDSSAPFAARLKAKRLSAGRHILSAKVSFSAASGTPPRTLKRKIVRCSPPQPQFTG